MEYTTTVVGSYPKPPDEGQTFKVRKTLHALERGDASTEDLAAAQDELATQVIKEQEEAGIDIVSDGLVRWDDILTPIARQSAGFEIGGLLRWFDNNVYYRRPVCTGPIEWRGPSTVDAYRFAKSVATHEVKAIVPGPITFARLSVDEHYGTHEEFVLAIARLLAQEVFELEAAGAKHIQIDEPALLDAPEDIDLGSEALYVLTSELKEAETTLATYFGDIKRLGPQIFEYPVTYFGLDFVSGPENFQLVEQLPPEKSLQAGILDARNTKLETVEELDRVIELLGAKVTADRLRIAPSAGLEFLPREKARAKLHRLGEAARRGGQR
ncbi:MAG: methylcobamide--CoM methyltransferase [Actinomycetota bacterium]|nr:methylcobamide--CoM methyltransferase [Actinomycetota bacterium]